MAHKLMSHKWKVQCILLIVCIVISSVSIYLLGWKIFVGVNLIAFTNGIANRANKL